MCVITHVHLNQEKETIKHIFEMHLYSNILESVRKEINTKYKHVNDFKFTAAHFLVKILAVTN